MVASEKGHEIAASEHPATATIFWFVDLKVTFVHRPVVTCTGQNRQSLHAAVGRLKLRRR